MALMRVAATLLLPIRQASHVGETVKVTRLRPGGERPLRSRVASLLAEAGCVAPLDEADELIEAADSDEALIGPPRCSPGRRRAARLGYRVGPLCWPYRVVVHPGVYVPRWQSEPIVRRAVELLPDNGVAADLLHRVRCDSSCARTGAADGTGPGHRHRSCCLCLR